MNKSACAETRRTPNLATQSLREYCAEPIAVIGFDDQPRKSAIKATMIIAIRIADGKKSLSTGRG